MATKFGHIYTKNNSGAIDKFVPILDSTDIKHGDEDNVGEILDKSAKSVETEIESETTTTEELIEETIDSSNYFSLGIWDNNWNSLTVLDNLSEFSTNETLNVGQFTVPSGKTGVSISIFWENNNGEHGYYVFPNGTYYNFYPTVTISNSPYAEDTNNIGDGLISISELPSTGQTKTFYATCFGGSDNQANTTSTTEYTGTDVKFIISNIDGTNYSLSFIWEKLGTVTTTTKSLKTTTIANDDTETEETNTISGLLQNSNVTFNQELVSAKTYDINAHIELWDANS